MSSYLLYSYFLMLCKSRDEKRADGYGVNYSVFRFLASRVHNFVGYSCIIRFQFFGEHLLIGKISLLARHQYKKEKRAVFLIG